LNLSRSGVSLSTGIRGASVTFGRRGTYANVGLPGTGLSVRTRLDTPSAPRRRRRVEPDPPHDLAPFDVALRLQDTGDVTIQRATGEDLTRAEMTRLRQQHGAMVQRWLTEQVATLNEDYQTCIGIHRETPSPSPPLGLVVDDDIEEPPAEPNAPRVTLLDRLLFRAARHRRDIERMIDDHRQRRLDWQRRVSEIQERIESAQTVNRAAWDGNHRAMTYVFESRLASLPWPRETLASFQFRGSDGIDIDVDLPEIEHLPASIARVASRGIRVEFSERSAVERRRDYQQLVCGTVFRVIGEALACLPTIDYVTVSGYTQRQNPHAGQVSDDYVISAHVHRRDWIGLDFHGLADLDPREALASFQLAYSPDRSGNLRTITPLNDGVTPDAN